MDYENCFNFRDWGIQLGRRFRALKLWFVIRDFGANGLREKVGSHIRWAGEVAQLVRDHKDFELHEPQHLGLVCFRFRPAGETADERINALNDRLMKELNAGGKIFLTHTRVNGLVTLRLVVGQTNQTREHVQNAWKLIRDTAAEIEAGSG